MTGTVDHSVRTHLSMQIVRRLVSHWETGETFLGFESTILPAFAECVKERSGEDLFTFLSELGNEEFADLSIKFFEWYGYSEL